MTEDDYFILFLRVILSLSLLMLCDDGMSSSGLPHTESSSPPPTPRYNIYCMYDSDDGDKVGII